MSIDIAFFRRDRALSISETEDGRILVRMGVKSGNDWQWVTVGLSNMEALYLAEALEDFVERLRAEGKLFQNRRINDENNGGNSGNGENGWGE